MLSKNCKHCNIIFFKKVNTSKKNWNTKVTFCSRHCQNQWRVGNPEYKNKLNLSGLFLGHKKGNTHGFKLGVPPWNKGRKHSIDVRIKIKNARAKQTFPRGDKHWLWEGGLTPINKTVRNIDKYAEWRTQVFLRDNRTCVMCRSKKDIEADHIVPISVLIRMFQIKTGDEARICDALWDIKNGRTLCHNCHVATPTYARKAKYY